MLRPNVNKDKSGMMMDVRVPYYGDMACPTASDGNIDFLSAFVFVYLFGRGILCSSYSSYSSCSSISGMNSMICQCRNNVDLQNQNWRRQIQELHGKELTSSFENSRFNLDQVLMKECTRVGTEQSST